MQMPACEYTCALLNLTSGSIGAAQPLAKARCVVLHTEWCMMQLSRVLQPIALPDVEGLDSFKVGQRPHDSCAWSWVHMPTAVGPICPPHDFHFIISKQVEHAGGHPPTLEVPDPRDATRVMHDDPDTKAANAGNENPPPFEGHAKTQQ